MMWILHMFLSNTFFYYLHNNVDINLELRSYKKKHGHMNVPANTSSLGRWTRIQRSYYQAKRRGQKIKGLSGFTDERVKALNELGFDWESQNGRHRSGKKKTV